MCYPKPGPRCSSHTWNDRVKRHRAHADAKARYEQVQSVASAWRAANPNADTPTALLAAIDEAEVNLTVATESYRRANKDWHQTPHGLATLNFQLAQAGGFIDESTVDGYRAAAQRVAAILSDIGDVEAAGGKPTAAQSAERRDAMVAYGNAVTDAAYAFNAQVATFMARNPAEYGLTGRIAPEKIDFRNVDHVKGILGYCSEARIAGKVANPEVFTRFSHTLAAAASERTWSSKVVDTKDEEDSNADEETQAKAAAAAAAKAEAEAKARWLGNEPMDKHQAYTAEAEQSLRRRLNPETTYALTDGEMYGDNVREERALAARNDAHGAARAATRARATAEGLGMGDHLDDPAASPNVLVQAIKVA